MPPQAFALAAVLAWNWQRSTTGRLTLSQAARRHPLAFVVGWAGLTCWLVPHVVRGEHVTDRAIRVLDGLHRG